MAKKVAELKTKENSASVEAFLNTIKEDQKRKDCFAILELMKAATGEKPKMWGTSIVGFGNIRYKSPNTGREVEWMNIGFSPHKANISLYLTTDITKHEDDLKKLGKHKSGVGCLYINKLEDVDVAILKKIIAASVKKK